MGSPADRPQQSCRPPCHTNATDPLTCRFVYAPLPTNNTNADRGGR